MTVIKPFGMVEMAVKELIEAKYEPAQGNVGGDLAYTGKPLYVWISLIPGGATDEVYGQWVLDIDVFAPAYGEAMNHALALEAALLGPRHRTSVMLLDQCYQNEGPAERPWDDETTFRIGSTYVFTGRRPA